MRKTFKAKRAPWICAAVFVAILGGYLAAVLYAMLNIARGETFAMVFLVLYLLILLAVIGGILLALRQRLREIDRGEEEEAKKY